MKNNLYFIILYLAIVFSISHRPSGHHRSNPDVFQRNEKQRHPFNDNCPPGHIRIAGECIDNEEFENLKIFGTITFIILKMKEIFIFPN